MADQLGICNRSLLSIGARAQVSSISPSDGSTAADACSVLYTPTFEALARTAQWGCLRKQATLSLLKAASGTPENQSGTTLLIPPSPWLYEYAYPSDCLAVRKLIPSYQPLSAGGVPQTTINNVAASWIPNSGQIPYVIAYDTDASGNPVRSILTNLSQAQIVYTVNQPNPVIWDSLFQEAMVRSLGAYLVPALSLNVALMKAAISAADNMIAQARATDANEGVTVMDHLPDFIRARGFNTGNWDFGGSSNGYGGWGYNDMAWPL